MKASLKDYDVIIVGAGAAGMMCGWEAGKRGRRALIIEHMHKIGEKIRISGGGRCNFTNLHSSPANFLSQNPHFCKSALSRYTPHDFIALVDAHNISWHEKPYVELAGNENARGQLFCDNSATQIIDMLKNGCESAGVTFLLGTKISEVRHQDGRYVLETPGDMYVCDSLVVASGGLSIPKIGASNFGYELAKKFGHNIIPPRPALVPLTFDEKLLERTKPLSGLAVDAIVSCRTRRFREGLLFTHRGLSGPSVLQVSSYWREGDEISVDLLPEGDVFAFLKHAKNLHPKQQLRSVLSEAMPARLAALIEDLSECHLKVAELSDKNIRNVADIVKNMKILPSGTEGYRTAEVTLGGVDTTQVSSKTFESSSVKGLYFVGEVLDVTGHLGGHNFQWAWSSGWSAGKFA